MTKTDLITAINTQLTAIITQAKVRLASLNIINSLFPAELLQEITTGDVTCKLYYKKIGNECRVTGFIKNNSVNILTNRTLITIPSVEFFAKNLQETQDICIDDVNNYLALVSISNNIIFLIGSLPSNRRVRINVSYQTND